MPDASESEIRQHFERLFRLDIEDEYDELGKFAVILQCLKRLRRGKNMSRTGSFKGNGVSTQSKKDPGLTKKSPSSGANKVHALDATVSEGKGLGGVHTSEIRQQEMKGLGVSTAAISGSKRDHSMDSHIGGPHAVLSESATVVTLQYGPLVGVVCDYLCELWCACVHVQFTCITVNYCTIVGWFIGPYTQH